MNHIVTVVIAKAALGAGLALGFATMPHALAHDRQGRWLAPTPPRSAMTVANGIIIEETRAVGIAPRWATESVVSATHRERSHATGRSRTPTAPRRTARNRTLRMGRGLLRRRLQLTVAHSHHPVHHRPGVRSSRSMRGGGRGRGA